MEGVILFADDHVFEVDRHENRLFVKLNNTDGISILPINNLNVLEKTISSVSTYRAIILDWNFERIDVAELDLEGVSISDENPMQIISESPLYCLIYIYSEKVISTEIQDSLKIIYGDKIQFRQKVSALDQIDDEVSKIVSEIKLFQESNSHMAVPYEWSRAINKSSQLIFSELEKSDKFWIKELFYSSVLKADKSTGQPLKVEMDPSVEVVNLFQNILNERLIQNEDLRNAISKYSVEHFQKEVDSKAILSLYSNLYYTQTLDTDVVMTGDIYKLSENCFGAIISPECDISKLIRKNEMVDFLCFSLESFSKLSDFCNSDEDKKRAYNQEISAIHLLPAFTFDEDNIGTALIDFRFGLRQINGKYLEDNKADRKLKLNSPYIQQLRQRYLSYVGRVGVPAIPDSLKFIESPQK